MKQFKLLITFLFLLTINSGVFSQPEEDFKPSYSVGGLIFTGWQFNIDDAEFISKLDTSSSGIDNNSVFGFKPTKNQFEVSRNTFYLERGYINIKAALTQQINVRLTPDINSSTDGTGRTQFDYQVKFAYLDYTPFTSKNGSSLTFTLGVSPNQWVSNIERFYGYRFVAKTLTDYQYVTSASRIGNTVIKTTGSYFSTADLGLTTKFTFPNKYAELYAAVVNGNGFKDLSFDNRFKDVQITGFVYPLADMLNKKMEQVKKSGKERIDGIADFTIGGFAYLGKLDRGENYNGAEFKRNRFGGMLNLKYNFKKTGFFKIGGEFSVQKNESPSLGNPLSSSATDANGISAYFELCPPIEKLNEKLSLLLRYDIFDPNTADNASAIIRGFDADNDNQNLIIIGLFYKPAKVFSFGFSYHMMKYQDNFVVKYDGALTDKLDRLFFNTVLDF